MDKADKILAAIEHLAVKFTRMESDISVLKTDVSGLKYGMSALGADVAQLKDGQARILAHLDVAELKGRVEEQSRAIASLIPTKVAAVPGR